MAVPLPLLSNSIPMIKKCLRCNGEFETQGHGKYCGSLKEGVGCARFMRYLWSKNWTERNRELKRELDRKYSRKKLDNNRMRFSPFRTRFTIFMRDNFSCQYCGMRAPETILEVDHKIPISKGGKDLLENYVTSCRDCNLGKGNLTLV